jgi:bifunctional enzyme CysN/CysC
MITRVNNVPEIKRSFEAMLIWMDGRSPATLGKPYRIIHCNRDIKCRISHFRYSVDVNSLSRRNTTELAINEIGRVEIDAQTGLFADSYRQNKATGNFILVDELTNATVAAGMILDRQTADSLPGVRDALGRNLPEDQIIFPEKSGISMAERVARGRQKPLTIWFTGLSGAGKSEIGRELERLLFSQNFNSYLLDGDTLRTGLTSDLGFSSSERTENIRRVAEVARLFNDAGMIAICALISPLESDREMARKIVGRDHFFEIFVSTPLDICEQRDSKGLYKRARSGEVHHFTGISAPYERPHSPDLELTTVGRTALACAEAIIEMVRNKILA